MKVPGFTPGNRILRRQSRQLRIWLEEALGKWCRALAKDLYQIPGTDLYTLNPTLGTGRNPYRDVAGNQFAAAAAAKTPVQLPPITQTSASKATGTSRAGSATS